MTPKQARLGVDIFTAAVIASVAIALAGLTWRLQGYTGQSAAAAPVAPGFTNVDIAPIIALAPFGNAAGAAIQGSADGLQLRAVFAAIPVETSVALIALPDGQVVPFGIGEVTPGGIVEAIEPEKVTLRAEGGMRFLGFNPQDVSGAAGAAPPTPMVLPPVAGPPSVPRPESSSSGVAAIRALIPRTAASGNSRNTPAETPESPSTRSDDQ